MDKTAVEKFDKRKVWGALKQIQDVCRESKQCPGCPAEGLCFAEINDQYPGEWELEEDPKDGIFKRFKNG